MNDPIEIVLVVPDGVGEYSAGAMKLCELFVAKVLSSSMNEIDLSASERERQVSSNAPEVKELFAMFVGARLLRTFYQQLTALAHKKGRLGHFELKAITGGVAKIVSITEISELPNLRLRIETLVTPSQS